MKIEQTVKIKITKSNINKLALGKYSNIKLKDIVEFDVDFILEHMPFSNKIIFVQCDYCDSIFKRTILNHTKINNKNNSIQKDCCKSCSSEKYKENFMMTYGVTNPQQDREIREKTINTNINKYGYANPMMADEINQRRIRTNILKYGAKSPMSDKEVQEKVWKTNLEKYGIQNMCQSELFQKKCKESLIKKYGSISPFVDENVRKKRFDTLISHDGAVKTSIQQVKIYESLKIFYKDEFVFLNYPQYPLSIDIAIIKDNKKIAIEYDGWYWHRNQQRDIKKAYKLTSLGWNFIRIQSGRMIPQIEDLIPLINNVYDKDKKYQCITLSDWVEYETK